MIAMTQESAAKRHPVSARRGATRGPQNGFSLVETMIAMVILGIGLLWVAQMVPVALAGVTQAGVRTNAVQAAQERLDDLKASGFTDAPLEAGSYSETQGKYTLSWTVTDNVPVPGSKRIVMTASWNTAKGTQSATLNTLVSRGN